MGEPPAQSKAVPAETPVRDVGGAEAAETGPGSLLSSSGLLRTCFQPRVGKPWPHTPVPAPRRPRGGSEKPELLRALSWQGSLSYCDRVPALHFPASLGLLTWVFVGWKLGGRTGQSFKR